VLTADCVRGVGYRVGRECSRGIVRYLFKNIDDESEGKKI